MIPDELQEAIREAVTNLHEMSDWLDWEGHGPHSFKVYAAALNLQAALDEWVKEVSE